MLRLQSLAMSRNLSARREFLRFLAASPLVAMAQEPTAKDALSVLDFEPLAHKALPPAHWGYMSTGVDDDLTVRMNREAMGHYQLRARRLVGAAKPDLSFAIFGKTWDSPIYFSAVSAQRAFHPDGELGTARAAKAKKVTQMLSTVSSTSVEDVAKALGEPPWYQLYMPTTWDETEKLVRRVEAAGCEVLAWTIDILGGRNAETARAPGANRHAQLSDVPSVGTGRQSGKLQESREADVRGTLRRNESGGGGLELRRPAQEDDEDEAAAQRNRHGGGRGARPRARSRTAWWCRTTAGAPPRQAAGRSTSCRKWSTRWDARSRYLSTADSGAARTSSRRCRLGARAVGIGRPYVWGLAAYGQEGVERVIDILRAELIMTMRNCGVPSTARFTRDFVLRNGARL